jgi:hypothetical protein
MLPPELSQSYTPAPEDEALWLMMCRRATMEMVLRRYALQQPNLTIASGIRVNAYGDRDDRRPNADYRSNDSSSGRERGNL